MQGIQSALQEATTYFGKSWRLKLLEEFEKLASKERWKVEGVMPALSNQSDSEYRRNVRQYRQTYRKSGWVEKKPGVWIPPVRAKEGN